MSEEWVATGAEHVPPVDSEVTARLRVDWNSATAQLSYDARILGVPEAQVLFMHLHRAEAGHNGPVSVILSGRGELRSSGVVTLTPAQRMALGSGALYFDAHTTKHLAGVVRAQIALP